MRFALTACVGVLVLTSAGNARIPQDDQQRLGTQEPLKDGVAHTLPVSGATLQTPGPIRQIAGIGAARIWTALSGGPAPVGTEALLHDPRTGEMVFLQKLGLGYVAFDDWGTFDREAVLKSVSATVEHDNSRRRQAGLPGLRVVGWLEPPTLDRSANSVRWAMEASSDHGATVINSIALIFGRDGFEKLIWMGAPRFARSRNLLKIAQTSFSFPVGARYADYQRGDRALEYGLADTVAAVLGAKRPPE